MNKAPEHTRLPATVKRLFGTGGWWFAERVIALIALLASHVIIVRALSPDLFGALSVLLALLALLQPLMQFGVSGILGQALLRSPREEAGIFGSALLLRMLGCFTAGLVSIAMVYFGWVESPSFLLLLLLIGQCFSVFNVFDYHFQVTLKAEQLAPYRIAAIILGATAKIAAAIAEEGVDLIIIAFAFDFALQGAAYLIAYHRHAISISKLRIDRVWVTWLSARSPWLLLSGLAEVAYLKIDLLMINHFLSDSEAGQYAAATKLSELWFIVPIVIVTTIFPALWQYREQFHEWSKRLQMSLDALAWLGISVAVMTSFMAAPLISWLFGSEYSAAAAVLVIHIWGGVFVFMRALLSRWLISEDLLQFSLMTHLAGAVVNIALNLWCIPNFGIVGAAWATVISYAVAGWLSLFISRSTRGMAISMLRALLLPFRIRDLHRYVNALRSSRTTTSC